VTTIGSIVIRVAASVAVIGSLALTSVPALSHTSGTGAAAAADPAARQARMSERVEVRLNALAARLNISGSQQQAAWASYANVVRAQAQDLPARPPVDADAVTLLRYRSEVAHQHAQRLAQLADATAELSAALTPEQRDILNKSVRRSGQGDRHDHRPKGG
jgi:hypothetical protein